MQRNFAENTTNNPNYFSPTGYNTARFDTFHQLSAPQTLFGWLSVVPKVGVRGTFYNNSGNYSSTNGAITTIPTTTTNGVTQPNSLNWGGSVFRPVFNAGLETSFKVARNFEWMQSRLLGLDGVRHIFQPYANLSYVYAGGPNPNQIFQFDRYTPNNPNNLTTSGFQPSSTQLQPLDFPQFAAIDSIDTWAIMRLGVRNRLQTRRDDDTHDWFYLDSFFDVNGINPYINGPLSNFNNRITFSPVSWFSTHIDSQVPMTSQGFTEVNWGLDVMPARWLQVGVGSAYINNYNGMNGNQPSLNLRWKITDHWSFSASQLFNLDQSTPSTTTATGGNTGNSLLYQRYLINRDLSSWIVSFGVEVRNNQGTSTQSGLTQYGAVINLALKDLPELMVPMAFGAPSSANKNANPLVPSP